MKKHKEGWRYSVEFLDAEDRVVTLNEGVNHPSFASAADYVQEELTRQTQVWPNRIKRMQGGYWSVTGEHVDVNLPVEG
jgi:hypothetical protein